MTWGLLDAVLAVLALVLVGVLGYTLYRTVRSLLRRTGALSSLVAAAADGLAVVQPVAAHATDARQMAAPKRR